MTASVRSRGTARLWQAALVVLCVAADVSGTAAADSLQDTLESRPWRITSYFDGDQFRVPENAVPDAANPAVTRLLPWPWIQFAGGRIGGTSGCSGLAGSYTAAGNLLTLHVGFLIAPQCPPILAAQDAFIVRDLRDARRVKPNQGSLVLLDRSGVAQLVLTP